jgi:hypothetical protein
MDSQSAWRAVFLDLIDDVSRQLDSGLIERGHDDGQPLEIELDVDGHVVELCHNWNPAPDRVTARIPCGAIPEDASIETLKRLLEAQHDADPCEGRSFGLDAETGALLFVTSIGLLGLSGMDLLARLRNIFGALATLRDSDAAPSAEGSMREVILESFTS